MAFQTQRRASWGFSLLRQSAFGTALAPANINKSHPALSMDIPDITLEHEDNAEHAFKGHGHPTEVWGEKADLQMKRSFHGSSFILGWLAALNIANGTTTELSPGPPAVYQHEFTPLPESDAGFDPQVPVTTLIAHLYDGLQYLCRDIAGKGFTISGQQQQRLKVDADFIGSGYFESDATALPDLVTTSFLKTGNVILNYNSQDIKAPLQEFSFKYENQLIDDGYGPGSAKMTFGNQDYFCRKYILKDGDTNSLNFKMLLDSTMSLESDHQQAQERPIILTCEGSVIQGEFKHKLEISMPKTVIRSRKIGTDKNYYVVDVEVKPNFDTGIDAPFKLTVINDVPEYLGNPT
jgi:hypothetical protein